MVELSKVTNKMINLAKEKELDSWKENEVYEEVKEEEGM